MDMLTEAFRHPLYSPKLIKIEIQAINHEFFEKIKTERIGIDIIRQLSSDKTSYNGITCGNNDTLNPFESDSLSKKLKGYHKIIRNPSNIFFILYSYKTMNESEEFANQYLNYTMHVFPDNEIDIEDKNKLEQNLKDIENNDIFDNKLYKHGFFYNINTNNISNMSNVLSIYYFLGKIDKECYYILDYISYLFYNPESLMKILRDKNYIIMDYNFAVNGDTLMKNNFYFSLSLKLTEDGVNNVNDILIIINKYIDIIKEEGYKFDYFNNFAKYINNKIALNFNKQAFINKNSFKEIAFNYLKDCKPEDILLSQKLDQFNYNQELLKKH